MYLLLLNIDFLTVSIIGNIREKFPLIGNIWKKFPRTLLHGGTLDNFIVAQNVNVVLPVERKSVYARQVRDG